MRRGGVGLLVLCVLLGTVAGVPMDVHNDTEFRLALRDPSVDVIRFMNDIELAKESWTEFTVDVHRNLTILGARPASLTIPPLPMGRIMCTTPECNFKIVGPNLTLVQGTGHMSSPMSSAAFFSILSARGISNATMIRLEDYSAVAQSNDMFFNLESDFYNPAYIWWNKGPEIQCLNSTHLHLRSWNTSGLERVRAVLRNHTFKPPYAVVGGETVVRNILISLGDKYPNRSSVDMDAICRTLLLRKEGQGKKSDFPWWTMALLGAAVVIICGAVFWKKFWHRPGKQLRGVQRRMNDSAIEATGGFKVSTDSGLVRFIGLEGQYETPQNDTKSLGFDIEAGQLARVSGQPQAAGLHDPQEGTPAPSSLPSSQPMLLGVPNVPPSQQMSFESDLYLEGTGFSSYGPPLDPRLELELDSIVDSVGSVQENWAHNNVARTYSEVTRNNPFGCEVVLCLGGGGYGVVYKAQWHGELVALKVLCHRVHGQGGVSEAQALGEATLSSSLKHPNIVATLAYSTSETEPVLQESGPYSEQDGQVDQADGEPLACTYIVMELCDRGTLRDLVRGPSWNPCGRDLGVALSVLLDVARAVAYLHDQGIIHGDLKSNNVLLTTDDTLPRGFGVKVADFGISHLIQSTGNSCTSISKARGTLSHMAPELMQHNQLSRGADIYAFGVLIYELMTGLCPFLLHSTANVVYIVTMGQVAEVLRFPDACPRWLVELAHCCWSKERQKRPPIMKVMQELEAMVPEEHKVKQDLRPNLGPRGGQDGGRPYTSHTLEGGAVRDPERTGGGGGGGGGGVEPGSALTASVSTRIPDDDAMVESEAGSSRADMSSR